MFGLDWKSVAIGAAIGYFVVPRITGPIMAKVNEAKESLS